MIDQTFGCLMLKVEGAEKTTRNLRTTRQCVTQHRRSEEDY